MTKISNQCKELLQAKQDGDFKKVLSLGKRLASTIDKPNYLDPELFKDPDVRAARRLIRQLKRAEYIKKPKNPKVYRGGAPGQGKRS